jgi:hypothetical protein
VLVVCRVACRLHDKSVMISIYIIYILYIYIYMHTHIYMYPYKTKPGSLTGCVFGEIGGEVRQLHAVEAFEDLLCNEGRKRGRKEGR